MTINIDTIINLARTGKRTEAYLLARERQKEQTKDIPTLLLLSWLSTTPLESFYWVFLSRQISNQDARVQKAWQNLPAITGQELIEHAQKIVWPYKNIRLPMHVALKEKKITVKDLAWASRNASQRTTRWAAAILVAQQQNKLSGQMHPAEAMNINWPFKKINLPLEEAVNRLKIDFNDLCYAIVNGHSQLPLAAGIMSAQIIYETLVEPQKKQSNTASQSKSIAPPPSKSKKSKKTTHKKQPFNIIRGSTYLQEQFIKAQRKKEVLRKLSVGLLFGLAVPVSLYGSFTSRWLWFIIGLTMMAALNFGIINPLQKIRQTVKNYEKGLQGEVIVENTLKSILTDGWTLFRNVDLPDKQGDIDGVLIGPHGIFVLEVKSYSGRYRNKGKEWQYKHGLGWKPVENNPTRQALANAKRLHDFLLENADIKQWVIPRIFWVGDNLQIEKPSVPIWLTHKTEWILDDIKNNKEIDPDTLKRIYAILKTYTIGYKHAGK